WIAISLVSAPNALVDKANPQAFADLRLRSLQLHAVIDQATLDGSDATSAQFEARTALWSLDSLLGPQAPADTTWVLATGYVDALRVAHRAEQAALIFAPLSFVVRVATEDAARLDGSDI